MKRYVIKRPEGAGLPDRLARYREELNAEQYAVATSPPGAALVIAGAGSGKTRAITYRVAYLVEHGVAPARIMLATFTNRAAREMLRRVEQLTGGGSDVARRVWGGTFHRIANLVLRRHAASLGYSQNYSILDAEDAKDFISVCVAEAGEDTRARRFPKAEVLQDIISFATNTDRPIDEVVARRYPHFEPLSQQITRVDRLFMERKRERNVMDYDDLLLNWKRLLEEREEVARIYREQFEHVLVDEYQDTNRLQAEIVDLLAVRHKSVMVVGDDAQSIFAFRGASVESIYEFPKRYPEARVYKLETNYRSTPEILAVANVSIASNRRQFPKTLRAARPSLGLSPALVPCRDADQQAAFIAARILELRDEGVALNETAVLYRSHYHSLELQLELTRRGIPYRVRSGVRFFEQAHIKDVVAYLRLVANPRDELAWKRVLKLIPNVGTATANRVWERLQLAADPLALVVRGEADSTANRRGTGWPSSARSSKSWSKTRRAPTPRARSRRCSRAATKTTWRATTRTPRRASKTSASSPTTARASTRPTSSSPNSRCFRPSATARRRRSRPRTWSPAATRTNCSPSPRSTKRRGWSGAPSSSSGPPTASSPAPARCATPRARRRNAASGTSPSRAPATSSTSPTPSWSPTTRPARPSSNAPPASSPKSPPTSTKSGASKKRPPRRPRSTPPTKAATRRAKTTAAAKATSTELT